MNHVVTTYEVFGSEHERGAEDIRVQTTNRELTAMRLRQIGYKKVTSKQFKSIPAKEMHKISPYKY